jgi:hypothetical protein
MNSLCQFFKNTLIGVTKELILKVSYNRYKDKELVLIKKDNSEDNISWRKAVNQRRTSHHSEVRKALRTAIIDQVLDFRRTIPNGVICDICKKEIISGLHTDHEIYFEDIVQAWMKANKLTDSIIKVTNNGDTDRHITDKRLLVNWQEFHKKHAILRATHAICNLKRKRT